MNILVTGVKGTLGSQVAAALTKQGHKVVGADFVQADIPGVECIAPDMADYQTCIALGREMDTIVHLGAYHGAHLDYRNGDKTEKDFFDANITGTFNMLRSAVENRVPKVVWASSVVVYERGRWSVFGIYSLTKVVGEEMCQYFNHRHHLKVLGLRFGTFGPTNFLNLGFGMLTNRVAEEEVIKSVIAALANQTISFGMYDVQTPLPFTPEDEWLYRRGQRVEMLQRHWPQHADLIEKYAQHLPPKIDSVDVRRTEEDLDWHVVYDFGWFLDELSKRDREGTIHP